MQMQEQAYRAHQVVEFLRLLLRKVSGKLLIIWDGSPIHRAKEIKEVLAAGAAKRLHLERLPGSAASAESAGGRLELAQTSGVEKPVLLEPLSFAQCLGAGKRTPAPSKAEPSVVFSSRFGNALERCADLSKLSKSHYAAEPLLGSYQAQSGFKLYRRHRLLAETCQDIALTHFW